MRTASGMSVTVGTWRRYSWRAVSRPAKPRCQPSIIASENAHAHAVAQVTHGTQRHGSRCATAWPHSTAAAPITMAGTVPHPTWAFHHPKIGAVPAKSWKRSGVALISGVTMPRSQMRHHEGRDDKDDADGDRRRLPSTDLHDALVHPHRRRHAVDHTHAGCRKVASPVSSQQFTEYSFQNGRNVKHGPPPQVRRVRRHRGRPR